MEVVTDDIRIADHDNPRGYWEFEKAKAIKRDASWLPDTRGKAFKAVSLLLYDLPRSERYRIIFMQRPLDEILDSQEKMLERLRQRAAAPRAQIQRSFTLHLDRLHRWIDEQANMVVLRLNYHDVVERPDAEVEKVNAFLGGQLNVAQMVTAVDASLYRNRKR